MDNYENDDLVDEDELDHYDSLIRQAIDLECPDAETVRDFVMLNW